MLLIAPNGSKVEASDEAAPKLMEQGWSKAQAEKAEKKTTTRKRAAKPKE